MSYYIVGLGNPGEQYEKSRHNTGRIVLEYFGKKNKYTEWIYDKKLNARTAFGKLGKEKVILIEPETYMNKSGTSLRQIIRSKKEAEKLILLHDDIDLPLGGFKISFDRGGAGHRGVQSVIGAVKTRCFTRIRVGISPQTPSGKTKKPHGKEPVAEFILGDFSSLQMKRLQAVLPKITEAISVIITENRGRAMNLFN